MAGASQDKSIWLDETADADRFRTADGVTCTVNLNPAILFEKDGSF